MRAELLFDLDEPYDREAHLRCVKALDMASALSDIAYLWKTMERFYEYAEGNEDDAFEVIERYKTHILEVINDHGLNIEELIS